MKNGVLRRFWVGLFGWLHNFFENFAKTRFFSQKREKLANLSVKSHEKVVFSLFFLHKIHEKGAISTQNKPKAIPRFFAEAGKPLGSEKGVFFVQIAQKCPFQVRLTE
ncbi:MAG: hypothetical protein IJO76_03750 [Clostridia bacterium]|nr:hypothetical protein [Clostridia bacterium]